MANRPPAPGGRNKVIGVRVTDHELAWVHAHKPTGLSAGQYLALLLANEQARIAYEEHQAQLGETD